MIKFLAMDVDGTLTDGKIYLSNSGDEFKVFDIKDGMGIKIAMNHSIIPVVITGRTSKIVTRRCQELGIVEIYQGIDDKLKVLEDILKKYGANYENIAYIGDDVNDIVCIEKCGYSGCPLDAVNLVKKKVDFISSFNGGNGAVRDFIEKLISLNEKM